MMNEKVVLITGANGGIGFATALELAKEGAHVVLLCRNEQKGKKALEQIQAVSPLKEAELLLCDLALQSSIRAAAKTFLSIHPKLDVLIHNAGIYARKRKVTEDQIEETFAVNHLAPFLLTQLLLPALQQAASARIITLSSRLHTWGKMHFDDLQLTKNYSGLKAYSQSKLANVLFTKELARRVKPYGITANAVHPGSVGTDLFRDYHLPAMFQKLYSWFSITPLQGAQTSIYLASSPKVENITGGYFAKCREVAPSKAAQNDTDAKRLWELSETLTKLNSALNEKQN